MKEYLYCVHQVKLRVSTNNLTIAYGFQKILSHFRQEILDIPIDLELIFKEVQSRSEIPSFFLSPDAIISSAHRKTVGNLPGSEWSCTIYQNDGLKIADFQDQGLLIIDNQQNRIEGYLIKPDTIHPDFQSFLFYFALTELLKQKGLYTIHAAALEKNGCGLLIPGASGRGKTTCCISLLRAGYQLLSDDHPLLRENETGVEILPFPEKIDVTKKTIEFFPELKSAKEHLRQGTQKQYFYREDFYPYPQASPCKPSVIIFPYILDCPKSYLQPFPKSRSLEELLPQGLLVLDKNIARHQFQVLSRLVKNADCYQLFFGEDVLELPNLITPLLERTLALQKS